MGILLMLLSVMLNSGQHTLEERLFRRDSLLTPIEMQAMTTYWRLILVVFFSPIFSKIPVSTSICSSGVLENNIEAVRELLTNQKLIWLFSLSLAIYIPMQFTGMWIIKNQNAMQKVMAGLFKIFLLWLFFMIYPGYGHEDFNVVKMFGMALLSFGTVYYI